MNILDYAILGIIVLSSVIGMYNGFVVSVLNIVSFFASWIGAFLFYPLLSQLILNSKLYETLMYYSDGASKVTSIEQRSIPVSTMSQGQISEMIHNMQLPPPFDRLIESNMLHTSLKNVQSIGEYFNYSIANIIVNILSFLILFFVLRAVFMLIISMTKHITDLPVLKQFDGLFGLGLGLVRGLLIVFIVFAVVPIFLTLVPFDMIEMIIHDSVFAGFFYKYNIFTSFVKGVI